MENLESRKFFTLLLENLQVLCKDHLPYSSSVEVSGYLCLELDNFRKERYFLSELINKTGSVASASCCTQILKSNVKSHDIDTNRVEVSTQSSRSLNEDNEHGEVEILKSYVRSQDLNTNRVEIQTSRSLNEENDRGEVEIVSVQLYDNLVNKNQNMSANVVQCEREAGCEGSDHQMMVPRPDISCGDVEISHSEKTVSDSGGVRLCSETYGPQKEQLDIHDKRSGLEGQQEGTEMSDVQDFGHVKEESADSNVIDMVPGSYQTEQVKQLKERIQAISNAKMAAPWLGAPLIQSIRNSVEKVEMQQKQMKSQSATQSKSDVVGDYSGEMFPQHAVYGQPMFPTSHGNMAPSFQGMNSLNFLPNGVRMTSESLTEQVDDLVTQAVDAAQLSNLGTGYAYNVLNSPAKRLKSKREGPTYRVKQNWKYAVRQFENFLVHKGMEVVPICTFPPAQLDSLLCEFILWVKKNNGEDFHPWSVKNFFYHLECHLKEYGYGSSITKGPEFKRSRDVLKQKVNDLEAKLHEQSQVLKDFHGK